MRLPLLLVASLLTGTIWSAEPEGGITDDPRVFHTVVRRNGEEGVHTYRIPGLAVTAKGTLIAVFDLRHAGSGDLPADIDVGVSRSTDDGATWGPTIRALDYDRNVSGSSGNGVGDPAVLVDRNSGRIFVVALWSKGNRGWNGSGPGMTPDETGQLVITHSDDDGLTWSPPESITPQIKQPEWRLAFNGPGNGIQLKNGTLVFAAQFRDAAGKASSCFVFSHDQGETWDISPAAIPGEPPTSESAIAECDDGSLLLSMRNESRSGQRIWSRWTWSKSAQTLPPSPSGEGDRPRTSSQGTASVLSVRSKSLDERRWSEPWLDLPDPTCMASLVRHPDGLLLFSNPNHAKSRRRMTVRFSRDAGKTWSDGKLLDGRGAMYSCLTVLKDGRVGILYEGTGGLIFARFPLDWVTDQK